MARVIVVGDGPAGLSAALFLAKNDHEVVVYGRDETPMHYALLRNYLGIDEILGSDFQERARAQAAAQGAQLRDEEVAQLDRDGDGFIATLAGDAGDDHGDYVLLAGGKAAQSLATQLGAEFVGTSVVVDAQQATTVERVYAAGRVVRPDRSQAIISAGAGAVAALDILSREAGKDVHDWDSPQD
jgi:thioredoxin reductase (NADPH)